MSIRVPKMAIRIVSTPFEKGKLFAICLEGPETTRHYNLAKKSIPAGSSDWVRTDYWVFDTEFPSSMWYDFPAGNLF